MFKWIGGLLDSNEKEIGRLETIVNKINSLEPEYEELSSIQLQDKTAEFRKRITEAVADKSTHLEDTRKELDSARQQQNTAESEYERESASFRIKSLEEDVKKLEEEVRKAEVDYLNKLLPEAFAIVREAARRTIKQRHYDVQLMGGIVLHQGKIAEMRTGEGKTLTATLPLYLNALTGRGCHLVTVNDYLARRDPNWMGPVFHALGLSVACIFSQTPDNPMPSFIFDPAYEDENKTGWHLRPVTRREAYEADITYGTNNEFGFDYLRDNMVSDLSQCVQRSFEYAIVDEVDNLLIDEARTPLIISGAAEETGDLYKQVHSIVRSMKYKLERQEPATNQEKEAEEALEAEYDYIAYEKTRGVKETPRGQDKLARAFGLSVEALFGGEGDGNVRYSPDEARKHHAILTIFRKAMTANSLYKRDVDYVVKDGEIIIVDEFTGRLMYGRRYSEGLHQAIEAKEGVKVQRESMTYATVTFQNYFRMYKKLSGMTGTAETEAEEFGKIYKLDVVVIPTNKPPIREDFTDRIYKTEDGKFNAVVKEIDEMVKVGRPVLVGTVSIEKSEILSEKLKRKGIRHEVLNAKYHEKEANIIADAGKPGTVTVATNMAGRGVDIILGGSPPGYKIYEDIQEFIFRIEKEFFEATSNLLKDDPDYPRLIEEYNKNLNNLINTIKEIAEQLRLLEISDEHIGELELQEKLKQKIHEYFNTSNNWGNRIIAKLEQKSEELEKLGKTNVLSRLKQILGLKNKQAELKFDIDELIIKYTHEFQEWRTRHSRVVDAGGLHVIGTERHESRRIDNQLRGRAGRQGDQGSTRFFVSLEDDIIRRFGGDRVRGLMEWAGMDENTPIELGVLSRTIADVQKRVEGYNFDIRKHLVEYDDVVNKQREVIYAERKKVIGGADLKSNILDMVEREIRSETALHIDTRGINRDEEGLLKNLAVIFPIPPDISKDDLAQMDRQEIENKLAEAAYQVYEQREKEFGADMRLLERLVMLRIVDTQWVEHLTEMEEMRLGIGFQAVAQQDPLVAYKNRGAEEFQTLLDNIQKEIVHTVFHVAIKREQVAKPAPSAMAKAAGRENINKKPVPAGNKKPGRNDPCPCGSGKKYKHCCGR